mgnify:FL=1
MKKAVITGATGSIGRAIIDKLVNENIDVTVFYHKGSKRVDDIPDNSLIKKICCSLDELESFVPEENDYDVFYHLAWAGTTGAARDDTDLQLKNVKYTLNAVDLAKRMGCRKFIGAGSQAEYGICVKPLTSETPTFPFTGYGMAKLAAGQLSRLKCRKLGIDHAWVRVLSVYGKYDPENSVIKSAIRKFTANEKAEFSKGEQLWDFLSARDAADAFYLVGCDKEHNEKTYCLGSGTAEPLREYIEKIHEICASNSEIDFGAIPYSHNQVMFLQADISELTNDTGFVPKISFEAGIKELLD